MAPQAGEELKDWACPGAWARLPGPRHGPQPTRLGAPGTCIQLGGRRDARRQESPFPIGSPTLSPRPSAEGGVRSSLSSPKTVPKWLPGAQPGAAQLCPPQHWTGEVPTVSVQKRSPYPATQVPCTCVSTHVCNMAEWVPCAAGTKLGQGGTCREGHGLNCPGEKEGAGDTWGPYRGAFPRVAGCGGTDLKGSRACGWVVRVTWQGGAGAHGAASEGLPRGLWDRAGEGRGGSSDRSKSMGGWGGVLGPATLCAPQIAALPVLKGQAPGSRKDATCWVRVRAGVPLTQP